MHEAPSRVEDIRDVHSGLNRARMAVHRPGSAAEIAAIVKRSRTGLIAAGGRHAMGGQQMRSDGGALLDLSRMDRVLAVDTESGLVSAEAGICWPALIDGVIAAQSGGPVRWGIAQKQTGADSMSLGGALSANIHGRGLLMPPIVADVEDFDLVLADGSLVRCSRMENAELFGLAIGGYGLFGVITRVTLRLSPRRTLRRLVRVIDIEEAVPAAERRISEGFLYGDFQFDIDAHSPDFLTRGVFCGYCPIEGDPEPPPEQKRLSRDHWLELLTLAHTDKRRAFTLYAQQYLATDGQLYKSDTHQLSEYIEDYHTTVDVKTGAACAGSEMITELYVPPERLIEFLRAAAALLIENGTPVIYGTIRLIQPDTDTVLAWARRRYACIIFNLHLDHEPAAIERAADAFRGLIDLAASMEGSYYLTYHRFASPQQLERCYPRIHEFAAAKRRWDPRGVFSSLWWRHYEDALARTAAPGAVIGG